MVNRIAELLHRRATPSEEEKLVAQQVLDKLSPPTETARPSYHKGGGITRGISGLRQEVDPRARGIRDATRENSIHVFVGKLGVDNVVRQLQPRDFGRDDWTWQVSGNLSLVAPPDAVMGIYAVQVDPRESASPIRRLNIAVGGVRVTSVDLSFLYLPVAPKGDCTAPFMIDPTGYLDMPIIVSPKQFFNMDMPCNAPGDTVTLVLLGDIIEPNGATVCL